MLIHTNEGRKVIMVVLIDRKREKGRDRGKERGRGGEGYLEGKKERGEKKGYGRQLTKNNTIEVKKIKPNSNSVEIQKKIFQGISMESFWQSLKIHRWQFSEFPVQLTSPE